MKIAEPGFFSVFLLSVKYDLLSFSFENTAKRICFCNKKRRPESEYMLISLILTGINQKYFIPQFHIVLLRTGHFNF